MARRPQKPKGAPIQGAKLAPKMQELAENGAAKGNLKSRTNLLNSNNAHLGLSVPNTMSMKSFDKHFVVPGQKKKSNEIQDTEGLHNHPGFKLMVDRIKDQAQKATDRGLTDTALSFYPNEKRQVADVGERFNSARREKGLKEYFPHQPELAGALLQGGYSQNNTEHNRNRMIEKSATTGEIQPHLSTKMINNAIETDTHPMEAFGRAKLRDFTGSILDPHGYSGEHNGQKLGSGYTVDRHQHDTAIGRDFGITPINLNGDAGGERRYRVMQEAHRVAHQQFDPQGKLSPAQFQSLTWTGHPGA
jgi:hypothetical protein